jgi:hypothetical protein
MVDFGSGQGQSDFATAGVVCATPRIARSENAGMGRKTPFMDGHHVTISTILTHSLPIIPLSPYVVQMKTVELKDLGRILAAHAFCLNDLMGLFQLPSKLAFFLWERLPAFAAKFASAE